MYKAKDSIEYMINKEKKPNAEKIRNLWKRSGMTVGQISMLVGVKKNTFENWTMQRREPTNLEVWAINHIVSKKIGCQTNSDVFRSLKNEKIVKLIKSGKVKNWEEFLKTECEIKEQPSDITVLNIDVLRVLEDEKVALLIENALRIYGKKGIEKWLYSPAKADEIYAK